MIKFIFKTILRLVGFKLTGTYPHDVKKKIMVIAPHTSNWDFPLGLLIKAAEGFEINFIGKHSLFKPPFGWFFRALGGIPVDRTKSTNTVRTITKLYQEADKLTLAITPEGTRKKVTRMKKGFYFIAKAAEIPIYLIKFDYGKGEINFSDAFYPTDDEEKDLEFIEHYFDGVLGKIPENSYGNNR